MLINYSGSNTLTKILQLIKSKFDALAKVATTGSYNDLTDKPQIGTTSRVSISIASDGTSIISIPITVTDVTQLTVYQNGLILTPDVHYTATTSEITLVNYTANAGDIFTFVGTTEAGVALNGSASQVLFSDTTEDNRYDGCSTVQDALIKASKFNSDVKSIKVNDTEVKPGYDGSVNITVPEGSPVKSVSLYGTNVAADDTGNVNITGVVKTISINGTSVDISSTGDVSISGLVKTISLNGATLTTDSTGNVAITGLVKNISVNGTSLNTDASGNVSITGLVKTITVNGATVSTGSDGSVAITGLVKSLSVNGASYSPNSSGVLTLNNIMKTDSSQTMSARLVAQSNTEYTTKQVRNIIMSTAEPTSSDGSNGDIWLVYEA